MKTRTRKPKTEYAKVLKAFRNASDRHVLVLETTLSHQEKCKVFHLAELERKAGNELVAIMKRNYEQLVRTKRYRKLKTLYGQLKEKDTEDAKQARKQIAMQMNEMQKQYHVTWEDCRTLMIPIGKKYGLDSIFALTKAEDVWRGVEKCLYADGDSIHFSKHGELPAIRAKQSNRGIVIRNVEDALRFKLRGIDFGVMIRDRFEQEEVDAICRYLQQPDEIDTQAVLEFQESKRCISTFRPCYASLLCKTIRGKLRVYVHITIEGMAKPKYRKDGSLRHALGTGIMGCDIGTQTFAYTSDTEVGIKNLAERGGSIASNERKERLLYRAMDRSRRATNPQNYNPDGTIKKGRKCWHYSNRYKRLKEKHTELSRINAINRRLSINEDVNHLRSLCDTFVTEPKNAKKLQKKAKNTTRNANGKYNRKKRFGKSIKNRCPGYFQAQMKRKMQNTGGVYLEVPNDYRASQYDHTADTYVKKKLSARMYHLADGALVQRDWYSSYLLYSIDPTSLTIDKDRCGSQFDRQYAKEQAYIAWVKRNGIHILNSGIKAA